MLRHRAKRHQRTTGYLPHSPRRLLSRQAAVFRRPGVLPAEIIGIVGVAVQSVCIAGIFSVVKFPGFFVIAGIVAVLIIVQRVLIIAVVDNQAVLLPPLPADVFTVIVIRIGGVLGIVVCPTIQPCTIFTRSFFLGSVVTGAIVTCSIQSIAIN